MRQISPCRAPGRNCLWQGDSVRLIGLVLAPRWRTEPVSVKMILGVGFTRTSPHAHKHKRATRQK